MNTVIRQLSIINVLLISITFLFPKNVIAQAPLPTTTVPQTTQETAKIAWFRNAKFGMFIHWGLYSETEGYWKGDTSCAEWLMLQKHISSAEYGKLADTFDPVKFNADKVAKTAKDAGFKYVVLTAKHHEGFAMWNSR